MSLRVARAAGVPPGAFAGTAREGRPRSECRNACAGGRGRAAACPVCARASVAGAHGPAGAGARHRARGRRLRGRRAAFDARHAAGGNTLAAAAAGAAERLFGFAAFPFGTGGFARFTRFTLFFAFAHAPAPGFVFTPALFGREFVFARPFGVRLVRFRARGGLGARGRGRRGGGPRRFAGFARRGVFRFFRFLRGLPRGCGRGGLGLRFGGRRGAFRAARLAFGGALCGVAQRRFGRSGRGRGSDHGFGGGGGFGALRGGPVRSQRGERDQDR